jgi:hypothetical protein
VEAIKKIETGTELTFTSGDWERQAGKTFLATLT